MESGIYIIKNKVSKKFYVGLSKNIFARWHHHINASKNPKDKEYNKALYRAFRKYGIENFSFEILEYCPENQLSEREIYWINKLDAINKGYNETNNFQPEIHSTGENHPQHKLTEADVRDIRIRYAAHERCNEVEALYSDRIGHSGFCKIWKGETWKDIMPEVYTAENKLFHSHNTGNKGVKNGRVLVTEQDVINIRKRKLLGEIRSNVYQDYKDKIKLGGFDSIWYGMTWKTVVAK